MTFTPEEGYGEYDYPDLVEKWLKISFQIRMPLLKEPHLK